MVKDSKLWWWKPLWVGVILSSIALGAVGYFLWHFPLESLAGGLALTLFCVSVAYYIRIKPSLKVNRAIYILLGISPIGFVLWIVYVLSFGRYVTNYFGTWLSLLIGFTLPYIIGAFIGDWIGRRRNYRLPLSLFY